MISDVTPTLISVRWGMDSFLVVENVAGQHPEDQVPVPPRPPEITVGCRVTGNLLTHDDLKALEILAGSPVSSDRPSS